MGLISSLLVKLGLDSAQFETGIRRSVSWIKQLQDSIESNQRMMKSLTPMQKQVGGLFKTAGPEFTLQLRKQIGAQAELEDALFRTTHTQREVALRDAKQNFGAIKDEWAGNEKMMTLITLTETATRKYIMEEYAESSIATLRNLQITYMRSVRAFAVVGFAVRAVENLTESFVVLRDKGIVPAFETFVKGIPFIGSSIVATAGNIAELIKNTTVELQKYEGVVRRLAVQEKITNDILMMRESLSKDIAILKIAPALRAQAAAQEEYNKTMEEALKLEIQANRLRSKAVGPGGFTTGSLAQYHTGGRMLGEVEKIRAAAQEKYQLELNDIRAEGVRGIRKEANAIEEITGRLKELAATYGMAAFQIDIYKASMAGATWEELMGIRALYLDMEAMQKFNEVAKKSAETTAKFAENWARVFEETRTPLERLDATLKNLWETFQQTKETAEDWDTLGRAIYNAYDELMKSRKEITKIEHPKIREAMQIEPAYVNIPAMSMGATQHPELQRFDRMVAQGEETNKYLKNIEKKLTGLN